MYLFLFLRPVLSSTQWLLLLVVLLPVSVVSRARRPWETPLASLTAFSEQKKKTDERPIQIPSFLLVFFLRLIEGAHARTLANRQVSVQRKWMETARRDGKGQVLTSGGISTTEEVVTSTLELFSARNALAAQAPGWQLVNDGCQQHTTAVSVASS
jgi:hypothetical protein